VALRFKPDENVPGEATAFLRASGHDVSTALEQRLGGRPDAEVLDACREEARILVTLDLGFGDIHRYPPAAHEGVWVLRPGAHGIGPVLRMLEQALALAASEPSAKRLWIIEPAQVRIRD
jgi:predicted nuclease of predicted toxin-antitoxin system